MFIIYIYFFIIIFFLHLFISLNIFSFMPFGGGWGCCVSWFMPLRLVHVTCITIIQTWCWLLLILYEVFGWFFGERDFFLKTKWNVTEPYFLLWIDGKYEYLIKHSQKHTLSECLYIYIFNKIMNFISVIRS